MQRALARVDKGQRGELAASSMRFGAPTPMPIALASLASTTRATLAVASSLATGRAETP